MKRRRHVLTAILGGLPLLVLGLVWASGRSAGALWFTGLFWALAVVVLEWVTWRTVAAPVREMMRDLDVGDARQARRAVKSLRETSAACESERMRTSELLEDLTRSLGDGLLVVASDLSIRLINPAAIRFCGVDQVAPGTHFLEIMRHPDVVEAVEKAAGGSPHDPVILENSRGLWEVHAFPVRGGGSVVLFSDIGLVRRAAEFRRRFVQDLSHELRSPLTVLRTTVETLEEQVEPQIAAMLVRQVERIDRLTAELYELASIEAGAVELQLESVPVSVVVREILADFQPEAERAEVVLEFEACDDLKCWCDRRGLYRVLSNLVDNAIKYNRPEGWVRVRARPAEELVELEVSDSGEGIPPSELQAVLQRFYRVDRARTPGDGGLGLGLAIVKHMVHHMGGKLALDSRQQVGTTVTLSFPIVSTTS